MAKQTSRKGKTAKRYEARIKFNGEDIRFRAFTNEREAERFQNKLIDLRTAAKTGVTGEELQVWLSRLEREHPAIYDRLAAVGLVSERVKRHTVAELLEEHRKRGGVVPESKEVWDKVAKNLLDFFGMERTIDTITQQDAARFHEWLRTEPLNTRGKEPKPYATATVCRRIGHTKTVFTYAERLGWLERNPFRFLHGGDSVNPDRLEYVPCDTIFQVIENAPIRWQVILLLGRLCGLRGSSEMYDMRWDDIHFTNSEKYGWISVKTEKNKRHGRKFRSVPLFPRMEQVLLLWFEQSSEGEPMVFPKMKKKTNFATMTAKLAARAGVPCWRNPWYNLRKSYCTDLIRYVTDIPAYEAITDHSYQISKKHYQIMTGGRLADGMEQALEALDGFGRVPDGLESAPRFVDFQALESPRNTALPVCSAVSPFVSPFAPPLGQNVSPFVSPQGDYQQLPNEQGSTLTPYNTEDLVPIGNNSAKEKPRLLFIANGVHGEDRIRTCGGI